MFPWADPAIRLHTVPIRLALRSTQIWRLVTNFFIVSKPSFKLVIYCMWVVSYVVSASALLHWGQEVGSLVGDQRAPNITLHVLVGGCGSYRMWSALSCN